jgi:hypothetical protein
MPDPVCANRAPDLDAALASPDLMLYLLIGEYIAAHGQNACQETRARIASVVDAVTALPASPHKGAPGAPPPDAPSRRLFLPSRRV